MGPIPDYPLDSPIWWAYCLALVLAMIWDARWFRIPNELVLMLGALGASVLFMEASDLLAGHATVGGIVFIIGYLLFRYAAMGAGDAKLIIVVSFWSGPQGLPGFLFWLFVAMIGLLIILSLGRVIHARYRVPGTGWKAFQKDGPVPLAIAICPAAVVASSSFPGTLWPVFS